MPVSITVHDVPDEFWHRVTARVHGSGSRMPADAVLDARDSDRT